ncbi:hypothetical protein K0O13_08005 [Mammaliicoccus sciuri]|uniref:hypothetical protein n=1 Tax=Mammaliicoccus sciuri TaxID=1296 RepID=UPI001C62AE31|nr:hypothetical protein [Mammaliicoccus sciuri]QYG30043.1 hypothetical protein K0O13_08005 [Mammaliicoccus sciuri]
MSRYMIGVYHEHSVAFYDRKIDGIVWLTKIMPEIFPNKKKAKRIMKRLNKNHEGEYFLVSVKEYWKEVRKVKKENEIWKK